MSWQKDLVQNIKETFQNKEFISLHEPSLGEVEKTFLNDCIDSGFVSSVGAYVKRFETEVSHFCGSQFAIATSNGTSALHLSLILAGVNPGDEVLTQGLTFVATANAISYCGAFPVFLDSAEDNLGLSSEALRKFLGEKTITQNGQTVNKRTGRRIKACVPMHVFGHAVSIAEIKSICEEFNIFLIEDAAEAMGSRVGDRHLGNHGDLAVLSFNGNKVITTGGGGMILTNNESLAHQARHLSTTAKVPHSWEFYHDQVGYNYRLPNLNAALGCAQMTKLPKLLASKRELSQKYKDFCLSNSEIKFIDETPGTVSNFWLNAILVDSRTTRDSFLEFSNKNGVMTRPLWVLMSDLPAFKECETDGLIWARQYVDRVINLPSSGRL